MNVDWNCRYPERHCKDTTNTLMYALLDNFCRVKKCQVAEIQLVVFLFWKTFS
jgi:hypothetical protein